MCLGGTTEDNERYQGCYAKRGDGGRHWKSGRGAAESDQWRDYGTNGSLRHAQQGRCTPGGPRVGEGSVVALGVMRPRSVIFAGIVVAVLHLFIEKVRTFNPCHSASVRVQPSEEPSHSKVQGIAKE